MHAHTNTVKLDQRLASLENGIVQAEGLDLIREGLTDVQQKVASVWKTVYGFVLFCFVCLATLNVPVVA